MSAYFPFHASGFRCNPFRALTLGEWAEVAMVPEPLEAALSAGFSHLQILGEKGTGKTSALLALTRQWAREGRRVAYEYLPEGRTSFHTGTDGLDVFALDEAQRLCAAERARLLLLASGSPDRRRLVLGSHEDLAPLFSRHALPLVSVRIDTFTGAHIATVLERRLDYFALAGKPRATLTAGAHRYLQERFVADLRQAEHFLYEAFQRLKPTGPIGADQLRETAALIAGGPGPR